MCDPYRPGAAQHVGPAFGLLAGARHQYDPAGILTPGQGIFPPA